MIARWVPGLVVALVVSAGLGLAWAADANGRSDDLMPPDSPWGVEEVRSFFGKERIDPACWQLGGTWMGHQEIGAVSLLSWVPLDRWGLRLGVQFELLNWEPTIGGLFPTATAFTTFVGEGRRISFSEIDWFAVCHGVDAQGTVLYTIMNRGFINLPDCRTGVFGGTFGIYAPAQDVFSEEPLFGCYPMSPGVMHHIEGWDGCAAP
jgi:hypothetical protein